MSRDFLPGQDVALTDSAQRTTTPFYVWMQGIERMLAGGATLEQIEAAIAELKALIEDLPTGSFLPTTTMVLGQGSVVQFGTLAGGVVFMTLVNDSDAPGATYYYGTGPDGVKGWYSIASALAVDPRLTMTVDPVTGVVTFDLAELADSGVGAALVKITRDAYGRVEGTQAATTDDLTEGATNLYFTAQRVRDTLLTGLSLASSAVIAATDSVLSAFGQLQAQITALAASLSGYVPTSRTLTAGIGLDGGGDLSADRTFDLDAASLASLDLADSAVQPGDPATGLSMATDRLLGRSTAGAGAVEEIQIGANLSLLAGVLSATAGGGTVDTVTAADATVVVDATDPANLTVRFTHLPSGTIVGRIAVGTGIASALTPAQVRTLLNVADGAQPGTVTSVNASGGTTGLVFTGGPVTGSGTLTLSGTLGAANGGTGLSSYVTGNYIKAFGTTALTQVTPAQMQADMFSGALVSRSSNFAVATGAAPTTDMDWNSEEYDTDSYFSSGLDNSAFIIPDDGRYVVTAQINFAANATGQRVARVFVDRGSGYVNEAGAPTVRANAVTVAATMTELNLVSAPLDLNAGDKVLIRVGQDSGGSLNVVPAPSSWFSIKRVG